MSLIRWRPTREVEPFSRLRDFREELDRLFEGSLAPWSPLETGFFEQAWRPAIDISEDKDNIVVHAELPGLKKEEIDISIRGDTLTLKGEKKRESEVKDECYHRVERFYGTFQRSVTLPSYVDSDKIRATYRNGVLEVTLPKKEEAKARKVRIEGK